MHTILKGYHLLIAEDNPTNQIVVAKMIEQLGGSFDLASDGVEAIQMFDPQKHDLALLDIEMPRKSGLEVISYIRERGDTPQNFPIIALTAFVLSEHKNKIREAGADAVMAKPIIDMRQFGEEIRLHIHNKTGAPSSDVRAVDALLALEDELGAAVMPELVSSLKNDLGAIQSALESLLANPQSDANAAQLQSAAHRLSPLAQMLGDDTLAAQASACEGEANAMNADDCLARAEALLQGTQDAIKAVDQYKT